MIDRSPLAPVLRSIAFLEIAASASSGRVNALHLEQPPVLLHKRVLGLGQDALERRLVEVLDDVVQQLGSGQDGLSVHWLSATGTSDNRQNL
jgi:hypothetical protein